MSDNNHNLEHGHASLAVSILTGIMAWIGAHTISEIAKTGAAVISIAAGIMAIRYYYYATKKTKQ